MILWRCLLIAPTQAGGNRQYFCNQTKINGKLIPVTYIRSQSEPRKIITWEKTLGGQKPLQRCNQVTERLQQAEAKNELNMITTGLVKGQKVICTTDKYEGPCKTLL
ncbi:MAG: COP23 domain-containing protein [Snowella sp.]